MLNRPDQRVLQSLMRLKGHPDFEVVREWLAQSLDTNRREADTVKDEVLLRWKQGACQALDQILVTEATSRDSLQRGR